MLGLLCAISSHRLVRTVHENDRKLFLIRSLLPRRPSPHGPSANGTAGNG